MSDFTVKDVIDASDKGWIDTQEARDLARQRLGVYQAPEPEPSADSGAGGPQQTAPEAQPTPAAPEQPAQ
jgi:hypothetical protein